MLSQNALIVSVKCGTIYILSWHKVLFDIDGFLHIFYGAIRQLLKKIILNRERVASSDSERARAKGINTVLGPNLHR